MDIINVYVNKVNKIDLLEKNTIFFNFKDNDNNIGLINVNTFVN